MSGIGRCLPTGVQLEVRHINLQQAAAQQQQQQQAGAMPPPAPRGATQQQPREEPVLGWLDFNAGRQPQQAPQQQQAAQAQQRQQQQQQAPPARRPSPPVQVAAAEPVPGTLRIKLKLKRESSAGPSSVSPVDPGLLQSVRQLGTTAPVSPIPKAWRDLARSSPPALAAQAAEPAQQQGGVAADAPVAAAAGAPPTALVLSPASGKDPSSSFSPFESVSVEEYTQRVSGDGLQQQQQHEATPFGSVTGPDAIAAAVPPQAQAQPQPQAQPRQQQPAQLQRRRKEPSPPALAGTAGVAGIKRPASAAASVPDAATPVAAAAQAASPPAKRRRPEATATAQAPQLAASAQGRPASAQAAAGPGGEQQAQQAQPASGGDDTQLGTLAGLLPGVLEPAAATAVPRSGDVQKLQASLD